MKCRVVIAALFGIFCSFLLAEAQTVLWKQTFGSLPLKRVALSKYGVWLAARNDSTVALFDGMGAGLLDTFKMPGVDAIMPSPDGEYVYGMQEFTSGNYNQGVKIIRRGIQNHRDSVIVMFGNYAYDLHFPGPPYPKTMFATQDKTEIRWGSYQFASSVGASAIGSEAIGGIVDMNTGQQTSSGFIIGYSSNKKSHYWLSHRVVYYPGGGVGGTTQIASGFYYTRDSIKYKLDGAISGYYGLTYDGRYAATQYGIFDCTVKRYVSRAAINGRYISDRYVLYKDTSGVLGLFDIVRNEDAYRFDTIANGRCSDFDVIENNTVAAIYDSTIVVFRLPDNLQPMQTVADFVASDTLGKLGVPIIFENYTYPPDSAASYEWDFGDGQKSTEQFPKHTYTQTGTFTVILTVKLKNGKTLTVSKPTYITIPFQGQVMRWLRSLDSLTVYSLAFSPDSKMLAVGSNPSIPLLNVATGSTKVMLELAGRHSPVMGVQFSGDGQSLYHICFDPLVLTFNSNFFPVTSTYSNLLTAKFLIDTSYISTPQFQNIGTISTLRFFPSNSGWYLESEKCTPLLDIALSQNGSWLLSAFHSYQQAVFSMRIGIPTVTHYGSYDGVHGTLMRCDVKSNAIYYPLYPKKFNEMPTPGIMDSTCRAAFSVAMTGDTSMYITSENQLTVICKGQQYSQGYICLTDSSPYWLFVKDIATGRELRRYRDSSKCIRLSPDGFHILTRSGLWDVFAGTLVQKLDIGDLDRFEYLPDGVHVAAFFGGDSAAVRIFDVQKNQYVFSFGRLPNKARCMAVSPDGKYIALGLEQNNVALVEVPTFPVMKDNVNFALPMFGNPAENQAVRFVNATLPANENFTFAWNFGDGTTSAERSPNHSFAAAGHYNVTLTAYRNGVSAGSITKAVEVKAVSGVAEDAASSLRIEPNPAGESFSVRCAGETPSKATLYDALGNVIAASGFSCAAGECLARFDTSLLASGAYYCVVTAGNSLRALPVRVAR